MLPVLSPGTLSSDPADARFVVPPPPTAARLPAPQPNTRSGQESKGEQDLLEGARQSSRIERHFPQPKIDLQIVSRQHTRAKIYNV